MFASPVFGISGVICKPVFDFITHSNVLLSCKLTACVRSNVISALVFFYGFKNVSYHLWSHMHGFTIFCKIHAIFPDGTVWGRIWLIFRLIDVVTFLDDDFITSNLNLR